MCGRRVSQIARGGEGGLVNECFFLGSTRKAGGGRSAREFLGNRISPTYRAKQTALTSHRGLRSFFRRLALFSRRGRLRLPCQYRERKELFSKRCGLDPAFRRCNVRPWRPSPFVGRNKRRKPIGPRLSNLDAILRYAT